MIKTTDKKWSEPKGRSSIVPKPDSTSLKMQEGYRGYVIDIFEGLSRNNKPAIHSNISIHGRIIKSFTKEYHAQPLVIYQSIYDKSHDWIDKRQREK